MAAARLCSRQHPGRGGHGQVAAVPKELLWEIFWDLEMSLSGKVTCGEGLLSKRDQDCGIFRKQDKKIKYVYICF